MLEIKKGEKYGRLTTIEETDPHVTSGGRKIRKVLCKCDCGNNHITSLWHLRNGHTQSCGCYQISRITKHGLSRSSEYKIWNKLKNRCLDTRDDRYKDYGGRGIKVCKRWMKFENFIADMGKRPSLDYSVDRIDNDGNYEPKNCRWATHKEQSNNMRTNVKFLYNGAVYNLTELTKISKLRKHTLYTRIQRGWDICSAVETPLKIKRV